MNNYTYSKAHLIKVCHELHMTDSMISNMAKIAEHFERYNIHPVDCVLTKDFYPVIQFNEGKTAMREVESSYTEWIKKTYKKDSKIFAKLFEYYKRPTLKKFVQLLFRECMI